MFSFLLELIPRWQGYHLSAKAWAYVSGFNELFGKLLVNINWENPNYVTGIYCEGLALTIEDHLETTPWNLGVVVWVYKYAYICWRIFRAKTTMFANASCLNTALSSISSSRAHYTPLAKSKSCLHHDVSNRVLCRPFVPLIIHQCSDMYRYLVPSNCIAKV